MKIDKFEKIACFICLYLKLHKASNEKNDGIVDSETVKTIAECGTLERIANSGRLQRIAECWMLQRIDCSKG